MDGKEERGKLVPSERFSSNIVSTTVFSFFIVAAKPLRGLRRRNGIAFFSFPHVSGWLLFFFSRRADSLHGIVIEFFSARRWPERWRRRDGWKNDGLLRLCARTYAFFKLLSVHNDAIERTPGDVISEKIHRLVLFEWRKNRTGGRQSWGYDDSTCERWFVDQLCRGRRNFFQYGGAACLVFNNDRRCRRRGGLKSCSGLIGRVEFWKTFRFLQPSPRRDFIRVREAVWRIARLWYASDEPSSP